MMALRDAYLTLTGVKAFDAQSHHRPAATPLLSVDAFDTLITRSVFRPMDAFTLCGIQLREGGLIAVTPPEWRDYRHDAESRIAEAARPQEVRLREIYDRLVEMRVLDRQHRDAAIAIEQGVERTLSRPIAATIDWVNRFSAGGGNAMVLSDTYLPAEDLTAMLRQAGLTLPAGRIHASSQSGKTKRSGALFRDMVPRARGRGRALHIGDNFGADFRQARRAGLRASPYLAGAPSRFERGLFKNLQTPDLLGSVIAGSARATRLGRVLPTPHQQAIWDLSANMTGPLLFAFVAWTLREAIRRGLRTLYFFSRDGEILLKIAQALQPTLPRPIECRYLYVSRRSLHLPGLVELGEVERRWVLDCATHNSLAYLLRRLDIEVAEYVRLLPADSPLRRVDPDARMTDADAQAMRSSLDLDPVRTLILERAALRRTDCLNYVASEGLLAPGPIGVVDIGWRGRLQRSLSRIASTVEPGFADRLHGFYIDLDRPPTDAGTFDVFSALCPAGNFSWAARGSLFEILCAANHGTVTGYERDANGKAVPVLASPSNPEADAWGLTVQQDAVVAFAHEAAKGLILARIDPLEHVPALAEAALAAVKMFVAKPSHAEADAFGSFGHSSDEQHALTEPMAGKIDFRPHELLKRLGPAYRWRRISYWPEGSVARSVPSWLRLPALSVLQALPGRHG
jgi:FMN phosphatase YigB (HAD superfamily)